MDDSTHNGCNLGDERIEPTHGPKERSLKGIWLNRATYPLDPLTTGSTSTTGILRGYRQRVAFNSFAQTGGLPVQTPSSQPVTSSHPQSRNRSVDQGVRPDWSHPPSSRYGQFPAGWWTSVDTELTGRPIELRQPEQPET